jgi:hypothetical protein
VVGERYQKLVNKCLKVANITFQLEYHKYLKSPKSIIPRILQTSYSGINPTKWATGLTPKTHIQTNLNFN